MHNQPASRLRRFTLMELLVVLGLIMFISGMTFAVATALTTSKGPEGGARMISRMLELTRQFAISENGRAALLMPIMSDTLYTSNDTDLALQKICYPGEIPNTNGVVVRPCIIDQDDKFVRFVNNTEWVIFPDRVYFTPGTNMATKVTNIAFDGKTNLKSTAIRFKSNGSLVDTVNDVEDIKIRSTSKSAAKYKASVNWLTGKVKVEQE